MGLLDKLKDKSRGVLTAAKPDEGVPPASLDEVAERLLAISGRGIGTSRRGDTVEVTWAAKVLGAGVGGGRYENLYRSITVELDGGDHEAVGLCRKATTEAEIGWDGSGSGSMDWERGQHVGSETLHILAWLGPHATEGGADEKGYRFSWSQLRDPVIEAVVGAGWTYKPKRF